MITIKNLIKGIFFPLISIMLGVAVSACSDKADDEPGNALIGSWTVVSIDGESVDDEAYDFKADGSFVWIEYENGQVDEVTSNHRYTVSGNILRMDYNIEDGIADDYTIGEYTIKGNTLTYIRTWHDGAGKWDDDDLETIVMRRK